MSPQTIMNKIRYWDTLAAKWMMRHFYFMFFQGVLLIVFLFWFTNMFRVIDTTVDSQTLNRLEQIMVSQSVNMTIICLILILNSFWLLYIFNSMQRSFTTLKDISYELSRQRGPNPNKS